MPQEIAEMLMIRDAARTRLSQRTADEKAKAKPRMRDFLFGAVALVCLLAAFSYAFDNWLMTL